MDTFPDLGQLSDHKLKEKISELQRKEDEVSYQRRILHGQIDILRAELVSRLRAKHQEGESVITGADVQRLTDILAGRTARDDVPGTESGGPASDAEGEPEDRPGGAGGDPA